MLSTILVLYSKILISYADGIHSELFILCMILFLIFLYYSLDFHIIYVVG
jgi:hypothetical protein